MTSIRHVDRGLYKPGRGEVTRKRLPTPPARIARSRLGHDFYRRKYTHTKKKHPKDADYEHNKSLTPPPSRPTTSLHRRASTSASTLKSAFTRTWSAHTRQRPSKPRRRNRGRRRRARARASVGGRGGRVPGRGGRRWAGGVTPSERRAGRVGGLIDRVHSATVADLSFFGRPLLLVNV